MLALEFDRDNLTATPKRPGRRIISSHLPSKWSRGQPGRVRPAPVLAQGGIEAISLNAAVRRSIATMQPRLDALVQLTMELALEPLAARLDAGLLDFMLLNLVRNAANAMPEGGEVVVRTHGPRLGGSDRRPTVEVSVSDSGAGLPSAVARRATEAFFASTQGNSAKPGRWLADRFASACGGKVEIEAAPETGTMVRLVFPYATAA